MCQFAHGRIKRENALHTNKFSLKCFPVFTVFLLLGLPLGRFDSTALWGEKNVNLLLNGLCMCVDSSL